MNMSAESGMDLAQYAGAAASGPMAEPPEQKKREVDNVRYEYDYNADPASKEDLAQQRRYNPYGELNYFNPSYGERREVKVGAAQGGLLGLARGGALRFAEGDAVPKPDRIYPEPVLTPTPQLIPAQKAQGLAAAALQNQQLANQAPQFVAPNAITPTPTTFKAATEIASGYVPNRAENYTAATPATFQAGLTALQPKRKDLPGGFSGYGDASLVRQPPVVPYVDGTFPVAPPDPARAELEAVVRGYYETDLGRTPDQTEIDYWVGLKNQGLSGAEILKAFQNSAQLEIAGRTPTPVTPTPAPATSSSR
jgi:hypothetical protein